MEKVLTCVNVKKEELNRGGERKASRATSIIISECKVEMAVSSRSK